jgi:hypothetical protein
MKRPLVLALVLASCGGDEEKKEVKPVEPKSSELITFPCLSDTEPNHMAGQPSSGCPLQDTIGVSDPQSLWLMEYYQRFRRHIGLPCAEQREYAQAAAAWHTVYLTSHASAIFGYSACFVDGHFEKPGCDFFSGVHPRDQMIANGLDTNWDEWSGQNVSDGLGCVVDANDGIVGWMAGPFHRAWMMNPASDFAGAAVFWQNHQGFETWGTTLTMSRRADWQDNGSNDPTIVRYPKRNDTGVPRWFSGHETPEPPKPPGGWPSGYPVSIFAKPGHVWTSALLCLSSSSGTCLIPLPRTGIFNNSNVAHVYTNTPMAAHTRYYVQFLGQNPSGGSIAVDWTFTTGAQ